LVNKREKRNKLNIEEVVVDVVVVVGGIVVGIRG